MYMRCTLSVFGLDPAIKIEKDRTGRFHPFTKTNQTN